MELWKQILKKSITKIDDLSDFLQLTPSQREVIVRKKNFPLLLPIRLASKIKKSCLDDPIFKQFVPTQEELKSDFSFSCDPVQDNIFKKTSTLLHKYASRVLIVTTQACAMHCRYCFRQNFEYDSPQNFEEEINIINSDTSISEVILSGGDPLSLSDDRLHEILNLLNDIPHLKIIRFHTRFPLGIPERISENFLKVLQSAKKQVIFVIHTNHAIELDDDVIAALRKIQSLNIPILCQSVLLKGVNDEIETLKSLCWKLIENGIIPYYLHQLDRVQGAMHFEVSEKTGLNLIEELRKTIPGYAVFRFVKEIPKELHKSPII